MGVLVIFGSESDKAVFQPLMKGLKEKGIDARLEICSAHREPDRLKKILEESDEKLVVAGAGLSAALPGFVASHSNKLVIGLPVKANYLGLDALLSIHQMPKGFTVLGVGIEAIGEAVDAAEKILHGREKIVLVKPSESKEAEKRYEACRKQLEIDKVPFEETEDDTYTDKNAVYIDFIDLETVEAIDAEGQLAILVPIKNESDKQDALKISILSAKGLWVGLGRGENAAICAKKIIEGGR